MRRWQARGWQWQFAIVCCIAAQSGSAQESPEVRTTRTQAVDTTAPARTWTDATGTRKVEA